MRTGNIRAAVIHRDKACRKCGNARYLRAHHIKALADGGEDTTDNQITLCSYCHKEWHYIAEQSRDPKVFDLWLTLPPFYTIFKVLIETPELSELRTTLQALNAGFRDFRTQNLSGKPQA